MQNNNKSNNIHNILLLLALVTATLSISSYNEQEKLVFNTLNKALSENPYLIEGISFNNLVKTVHSIPPRIRHHLELTQFFVAGSQVYINYATHQIPPYVYQLQIWLQKQVNNKTNRMIRDCYFAVIPREEIRVEFIEEFIYNNQKQGTRLEKEVEAYSEIVKKLPAFMFAKDKSNPLEKNKFLLPAAELAFGKFTYPYPLHQYIGQWSDTLKELQQSRQQNQKLIALWRGSPRGYSIINFRNLKNPSIQFPRFELLRLSQNNPQLLNAQFTEELPIYLIPLYSIFNVSGQVQPNQMNMTERAKYMYQISADGWAPDCQRTAQILFSNSVLLRQNTSKICWFDQFTLNHDIYVPIKADWSDLLQKIKFLNQNQQKRKELIDNGFNYAQKYLTPFSITAYSIQLLSQYSHIQNYTFSYWQTKLAKLSQFQLGKAESLSFFQKFEIWRRLHSQQFEVFYLLVMVLKVFVFTKMILFCQSIWNFLEILVRKIQKS